MKQSPLKGSIHLCQAEYSKLKEGDQTESRECATRTIELVHTGPSLVLKFKEEGWSLRVKICPKARSPKVTCPPGKYLHECVKWQSYNFLFDLRKIDCGQILTLSDYPPLLQINKNRGETLFEKILLTSMHLA